MPTHQVRQARRKPLNTSFSRYGPLHSHTPASLLFQWSPDCAQDSPEGLLKHKLLTLSPKSHLFQNCIAYSLTYDFPYGF